MGLDKGAVIAVGATGVTTAGVVGSAAIAMGTEEIEVTGASGTIAAGGVIAMKPAAGVGSGTIGEDQMARGGVEAPLGKPFPLRPARRYMIRRDPRRVKSVRSVNSCSVLSSG